MATDEEVATYELYKEQLRRREVRLGTVTDVSCLDWIKVEIDDGELVKVHATGRMRKEAKFVEVGDRVIVTVDSPGLGYLFAFANDERYRVDAVALAQS